MLNKLQKVKIGSVLSFGDTKYLVTNIVDEGLFNEKHDSLLTVKVGHLDSVKIFTDKKIFSINEVLESIIS